MQRELVNIYVLSALFSGGRLFVGAISVLYVLSNGITIEQFATIKSVQIATFLLFDIPAGFFIKKMGFRFSLFVTFTVSIIGMILYACGSGMLAFTLGEFLLALSLCLSPTAFADYIMHFLTNSPDLIVEKVFHRNEVYTNIANIICGTLGGFLFTLTTNAPFLAAILLQFFGFCWAARIIAPQKGVNSELKLFEFVKSNINIRNLFDSKILIVMLLCFSVQLTIQPLLHYWQPFFLEINPHVSGTFFGSLFAIYCSFVIILNFLFSKLSKIYFFRSFYCIFSILACAVWSYYVASVSNSLCVSCISFCFLQGIMFVAMTCLSAMSNRVIETADRPIILKTISFFSRIGTLISLIGIKMFINNSSTSSKIHELYFYSTFILFACILACFVFYHQVQRPQEKYENH